MLRVENGFSDFVAEAKQLFPTAQDYCVNYGSTRGEPNCTYHDTSEGVVRVKWITQPTQQQADEIGVRLIEAVKPLSPQESAKKKRKAAIANLGAGVLALLRAMHEQKNKPFDDILMSVMNGADLQSPKQKDMVRP